MGLDGVLLAIALGLGPSPSPATSPGPEGVWQTRDDRTGAARALVRVSVRDGRLVGVIERLFLRPGEDAQPACVLCRGDRRGQPILGMEILRGHRAEGDRWTEGSVLDPENGKEYSSKVWLEGPDRLKVRGYWGPFHRTQTWWRQ
jgi:uncharacterized protein (DUF2147 family)